VSERDCPQELDWLSWIRQGRPSGFETDHLERCPACRARVEQLDQTADLQLGPVPDWSIDTAGETISFYAKGLTEPDPGDIWLSAKHFVSTECAYEDVDGVMFVVLNRATVEQGRRFVDVVPVWPDADLADDLDLRLDPEATSLGFSMACRPAQQLMLAFEQLDCKLGEVVSSAYELITRAVHGDIDLENRGLAYSSAYDPRIALNQELSVILECLRAPYEHTRHQATQAVEEAADAGQLAEVIPLFLQFRAAHEHRLAAAAPGATRRLFVYNSAECFEAQLTVDISTDRLWVEIKEVRDHWLDALWLVVMFRSGHKTYGRLHDEKFPLGNAEAHTEAEVAEAWLSPEMPHA
jgi:hypothetical protein